MADRKPHVEAAGEDEERMSDVTMLKDVLAESGPSYSVDRLEQDLQRLHAKWQVVQKEIGERDEVVAELREDIAAYKDRCRQLEDDAEHALAEKDEQLDKAQRDLDAMRDEKLALEEEIARQTNADSARSGEMRELETKKTELEVHLHDLQGYIDGRKSDWDEMQARLKQYENTIEGMSSKLKSHDDVVAAKESEKAAMAVRIVDLERDLAEINGRQDEKESRSAALQQTIEDQSRELGALNSDVIKLQKDIAGLKDMLEEKDETIQSLQRSLDDRETGKSNLEDRLADNKATIAELQGELFATRQRAEVLESARNERDENTGELRDRIEALTLEAAEHKIQATELQAVLTEVNAEKEALRNELDAQRELVDSLESELSSRHDKLDTLDRCGDRLSAIGSTVRDLDMKIDDHWLQAPRSDAAADDYEVPDEILLEPDELFSETEFAEHVIVTDENDGSEPVRYALNRHEMTIGRSRLSDIRINSKYISRVHAKIRVKGDTVTIEDVGSTNGFRVNSEQSSCHTLAHGDRLEIGMSKFKYLHSTPA